MNTVHKGLLAAAALVLSPLALADEYSGFFIGLSGGPSVYADDEMYDFYALDDDDTAWSAQVGYRINRWVSVDVAYADLGEYGVTDVAGFGPPPYRGSDTFRDVTIGATGYYPFGPGFAAYARLGVGGIDADWHGSWGDDSGVVSVFGAGIEWTPPEMRALTVRAGFESHSFQVEQQVWRNWGGFLFYYEEDYYQSISLLNLGVRVNF